MSYLETVDLLGVSDEIKKVELEKRIRDFMERSIDIALGPLFETLLLRLSECEYVLILALDHLVSDGASYFILNSEIWTLYDQAAQGKPWSLPQLPVQFGDYAVWQERTEENWRQKHEEYWRKRLKGVPRLELILAEERFAPVVLQFPFQKTMYTQLLDLARREGTLPSVVLLTAYAAAISQLRNERDLVLMLVSHGRNGYPELENMIGDLASNLHLRVNIEKDDTFRAVLNGIRTELAAAYRHQDHGRVGALVPLSSIALHLNWVPTSWTQQASRELGVSDRRITLEHLPIEAFDRPAVGQPRVPPHVPTAVVGIPWCKSHREAEQLLTICQAFFAAFVQGSLAVVGSVTSSSWPRIAS